jgi:hypothetical protein
MAAIEVQSRLPGVPTEVGELVRARLDRAGQLLERAVTHWNQAQEKKREWIEKRASSARARNWKKNLRAQRGCLARARVEWQSALKILARGPEAA